MFVNDPRNLVPGFDVKSSKMFVEKFKNNGMSSGSINEKFVSKILFNYVIVFLDITYVFILNVNGLLHFLFKPFLELNHLGYIFYL